MSIFEFSDYRSFLRHYLSGLPKKGRGKAQELAKHLRVHPTVVSQIFSGLREFSEEQALEVGEFLELAPIEAKYFRLLVRIANAGTQKLKSSLNLELNAVKIESKSLLTRVRVEKSLTDSERATFYSSWLYSACRLYCSTKEMGRSLDEIAGKFGVSRVKVLGIMTFLASTGLATLENDRYGMGAQSTFVDRDSPFLPKHLSNWRIRALQSIDSLKDDELMYSGPVSLSRSDFNILRERLADLIKEFTKVVNHSPAEEVACLNIDFVRIE
jgi:uncharacterized protein (TIGR02147 family)